MFSIAIHSYRGGTGKTLLATNLAALYSKEGKVCLLDYDFRAPSLHKLYQGGEPDYWLNDYLNGDCEITDSLVEINPNFHIGLACPDAEVIRSMLGKSRSWETEALRRTISLKDTLVDGGFNRILFDTAPGLAYSSINAVVGSDVVALVLRMDILDILGTKEMVKGVYELLDKPSFIVANMVLEAQKQAFGGILEKTFGNQTLAFIPCYCEVRSTIAKGKDILVDEQLGYSDALIKLSHEIENFSKS